MSKLEGIVRPFQTDDVFTARQLPPVQLPIEPQDDIEAVWGNPISLQFKAIGIKNLHGGAKLHETSRTTTTVRVENPSDSSQFVMVEKIRSLQMKDETGADHSFDFNP